MGIRRAGPTPEGQGRAKRPGNWQSRVRSTALGYALLAPSLFGVVTFLLLPMLVVAWLSLHRWDLLGPIQYAGLDNWRSVLTEPSFATSLVVTALFIVIVVPAHRCSD